MSQLFAVSCVRKHKRVLSFCSNNWLQMPNLEISNSKLEPSCNWRTQNFLQMFFQTHLPRLATINVQNVWAEAEICPLSP